jgi:hypothetical protein
MSETRETILWMVVRQDTHGNLNLVKDGLSEDEANACIDGFAENKPHKMDYFKISYVPEMRNVVIVTEGIRE